MPLTLGGFNGIDTDSMIQQLMWIEQAPLRRLESDKKEINSEIGIWQKINTNLATMQDRAAELTDIFNKMSVTSADDTIITASATDEAQAGTYAVEVNNLAKTDINASSQFADSTADLGYYGNITINSANGSLTVAVEETDSLTDIVDKINNHADNQNTNSDSINFEDDLVNASIIDNRLVIESAGTGTNNQLTIDDSSLMNNNGTTTDLTDDTAVSFNFTNKQTAANAAITVNGITISRESNQISDVITGLTLNLKGASEPGISTEITVNTDSDAIKEKIKGFVDQYNTLQGMIDGYGGEEGAILQGNSILSSLESTLYNSTVLPVKTISSSEWLADQPLSAAGNLVIDGTTIALNQTDTLTQIADKITTAGFTAVIKDNRLSIENGSNTPVDLSGSNSQVLRDLALPESISFNTISLLGIEVNDTGSLEIDEEKLDKAITDNLADLKQVFTGVNGVVGRLDRSIDLAIDTYDGYVNGRINTLEGEIEYIDEDIENLQRRLAMREERLTMQFAQMDQLLSQLNSQSSWLNAQFSSFGLQQ